MNLQAHMSSGKISGPMNNNLVGGSNVVGMAQSNGNAVYGGGGGDRGNFESDIQKARRFVQKKVFDYVMQRRPIQSVQSNELSTRKVLEVVRRVDDSLFSSASTLEEYVNLETLENRLRGFLRQLRGPGPNQQFQQQNNVNSGGTTMIPTPGSFMTNSGGMDSGSFNASVGGLANGGYQQPSSLFTANTGGNGMVSSSMGGGERSVSQMMPTPGFGNNSSASNGEAYVNLEANGGGGFSAVDSALVSQPLQQKQNVGGQNRRILHNLGTHIGGGIRNGTLSGGSGMMGNYPQAVNGSGNSEGQMPVPQMFQNDAYGGSAADSSGFGNFYAPSQSTGLVTNNRTVQSNMLTSQQNANMRPSIVQSEKINFQSPQTLPQNNVRPHQQSHLDQQPHRQRQFELKPHQQHQSEQKPLQQHQLEQKPHQPIKYEQQPHQPIQYERQPHQPHQLQQPHQPNQLQQLPHQQNELQQQPYQVLQQNQQTQHHQISLTAEQRQARNQIRWLLFLRHAEKCSAPEGKCAGYNCFIVQRLLRHMRTCNSMNTPPCTFPRCYHTKKLIEHHRKCRSQNCPVCVTVNSFIEKQKQKARAKCSMSKVPSSADGSCTEDASSGLMTRTVSDSIENLQPTLKRMKIEQPLQSVAPEVEIPEPPLSATGDPHVLQYPQSQEHQPVASCRQVKSEFAGGKMEISTHSAQGSPVSVEMKKDNVDGTFVRVPDGDSAISSDPVGYSKHDGVMIKEETDQAKQESVALPAESASGTKSGKPEVKGVSLTELFTPEQVREHITGLKQWVGQTRAKAEKNQAMEHLMSENSCQLCAVEKLNFEPPPLYCTPCGARIKRNAMYYTSGAGEARQYFCILCYNETRGDTITVDGTSYLKASLKKNKNDQETEEGWVQCDKCEAWQHQICALFNGRRNEGGQAEYTCPNCYIAEVERGERMPLPQSAVLGAKDLPKTLLSDHLEQRLFKQLKQERLERARIQGKTYDEVPGAEFLVIRVVSSVDKKLEVKPRFLEIFQEDNYPNEFSYKSKVVLLFQKIEGVEVCLFAMYVQEFGADCQQPNHRRVYLSYLDSVKYFRPEIRAVTGEALRTFVYHEILIGYLEYCKKRGFTSCYIWACPPLKGEDYILYCHPEIQKTPKSDKLREWYLSMLRKASKEKIVVELTNLYDHFFVASAGECKAKVTAARLPYFDGDYWPGAAEDILYQIQQEEDGGKQKKGASKKSITKRALRASGQADLSGNASKDLLLMHKLGDTIRPMKEDFIMVHLQYSCSHCCILMVSGNCWVCNQCKNFKLCDKCYDAEQKLEERERHPTNNQRGMHALYPVEISGVPEDTKDKDEILESEFFDTRQAFLGLCQGNHYQYDTLRRAKHSSMMVLYHLHNPTAPAFVTICHICHLDVESGQGWRCEICPDYELCNACYQKNGGVDHPHSLTNNPSTADRDAQNKEAREQRVLQLRKMLDLLVHAAQCRSPHCQYPNCRKVKRLFRHGIQCKTRSSGGCPLCRKMWYLLQIHARACRISDCHVPRCKDLREHMRRLQQQSDNRRRAAVTEMMKQRAAEVRGSS